MISNKCRPFGLFLFLILFGVVMEGYGQDCNTCTNQGNIQSFVILSAFLGDEDGVPIDPEDCNREGFQPFIYIRYTSNAPNPGLRFVRVVSNLLIKNNLPPNEEEDVLINELIDNVGPTPNQGGQRVPGVLKIPVDLSDYSFDCENQRLELTNIRVYWNNDRSPIDEDCSNANTQGRCVNIAQPVIEVGLASLAADFAFEIPCLDGSMPLLNSVIFFVNRLQGAGGSPTLSWSVLPPDEFSPSSGVNFFDYLVNNPPTEEIFRVQLTVTNGALTTTVVQEINLSGISQDIFEVPENQIIIRGDDELTPPNGSVLIDVPNPERFIFNWKMDNGDPITLDSESPRIDPDNPNSLTNLEAGRIYRLEMIDQTTGLSLCFDFDISSIPTPVIYADLSLDFNRNQRSVNFRWSTTKEWEASHFEIERAVSGTRFEKIGEVKAAGWSDQLTEYLFEDKLLPLAGGNLLYRLKQVDFNGDFEYSKVLSVRVPGMQITNGVWRIFPNPTIGDALRIELLDSKEYNGESLMANLITPTAGRRSLKGNTTQTIAEEVLGLLNANGKGVYVLEISWGQRIEYIKLIKN